MEGKTETYNGETWQTALKPSRLASPVMFIACTPIRCHEKGTLLLAPKIPSHSLLKRKELPESVACWLFFVSAVHLFPHLF